MKYPTLRYIYDRRHKASDSKPGAVEISVSFGGTQKYISTGVAVFPFQWSAKSLVVRHPDCAELNLRIEAVKKPISSYIARLMYENREFTYAGLEEELTMRKFDGSFVEFAETRIEERTDIAEGTRRNHRKILSALKDFGKMIKFSEFTRPRVMEFDQWLHGKGYKQVTIHSYHKFLKVYIHEAMARELIKNDPYMGVRIEEGKSAVRKYLTDAEIAKMRDCNTLTPSLSRVRDMFMFQYYTGMAYADLRKFDFSKAVERDGRYVIHDTRTKTQESFYIVLLSPAVEILRKYGFSLPMMTNEQYNMRLKAVAACAGVEKRVTSHMARHSFAVNALNSGIDLEVVSKMLGHSSSETTRIYAKIVNKSVESAFDLLERKIEGSSRPA